MAKDCTLDDLTVDAHTHGDIVEVDNYDGTKKLIIGQYREIIPDNIFCGNCNTYLPFGAFSDTDALVKSHLEEE